MAKDSQVIGNTYVFFWSDLFCLGFVHSVISETKKDIHAEALSHRFPENIQM